MSSTCFEPVGSSSGRRLYLQLWYTMFYKDQYIISTVGTNRQTDRHTLQPTVSLSGAGNADLRFKQWTILINSLCFTQNRT